VAGASRRGGGRGKTDCEPLFRALPASGQESYGTFGSFDLWEFGEGIVSH
jgi:hypothetical protein